MIALAATMAATASLALALAAAYERLHGRRLLDHPDDRSSHHRPTPTGGGIAIAVATAVGAVAAIGIGLLPPPGPAGLAVTASLAALAVVGWWDDHRPLPAWPRLIVHLGAASMIVAAVGPADPAWWLAPALVVAGAWWINLTNFMDGIDGLVASQYLLLGLVLAALASDAPTSVIALLVAAATAGFLVRNWPPARLFMGDVGSTFLGGCGWLLLILAWRDGLAPAALLCLAAPLAADASATLVRRLLRGEKPGLPHREHWYQRLARDRGHHRPVTLLWLALGLASATLAALVACFPRLSIPATLLCSAMFAMVARQAWNRGSEPPDRTGGSNRA